ncbi:hypothetical protein T07_1185 [Trichinella nelsoni]|uniref:Integrase catalytic domain-containing protein n=1 Tax=Trichinella nelsoni TaxID=6336 RepID=A0A0V0RD50_9BILA|nr:hypothetical protein T07_1185 [Trichinella nelsoni]
MVVSRSINALKRALICKPIWWAQYQIAVQADTEKMYLQVGLRVEDRDAFRFLWRNCVQDSPVRVYRLTRVCFELACSPYLAVSVIKAHAERNTEECDDIIKRALSNMYVDDLVMSCDEESEVAALICRVPVFLRKGGLGVRQVQTKEFATATNSAERLKKFQPFLDDEGILRMGGRLQQATLPPESKHSILLPSHYPLVELLIQDHHVRQLHAGVNQTLGRNAVKKVLRSLPEVKRSDTRVHKAYICIFTCMTTSVVHLELLKEQTTDSFLQGLRRFISRRGRPGVIQSDNFRSFKLADQYIQYLFRDSNWERLQHKLNQERIHPLVRRLWERLIRSIKNALRKTLRGALFTHDELQTTICEIEARINDRPIVLTGDNPSDRIALTPAHFLIGRELSILPNVTSETNQCVNKTGGINHLIRRWRYQQSLTAQLWKRWKQEYITTLSNSRKMAQHTTRTKIQEPGTTWTRWPIGTITAVHPSEDGVIRTAKVKTGQGTITRSARSLRLVEPSGGKDHRLHSTAL